MSSLHGTGQLLLLAARRDRIKMGLTVAITALSVFGAVPAAISAFGSEAERAQLVHLVATNPALLVLRGSPWGTSEGAVASMLLLGTLSLVIALVSTFAVIRHTRQNEELGRSELLSAQPIGRHAGFAAALLFVFAVDLVLGVTTFAGFAVTGFGTTGAVAAGAGVAAVGASLAVVAGICAQLFSTSRGANGAAAAIATAVWLLRGIGNAAGTIRPDGFTIDAAWITWLSPFGWSEQVRVYGAERWWPLAVSALWIATGTTLAAIVASRRDVGAGVIAPRPGPPRGTARLTTPLGLAWRQQRGILVGWTVGAAALGAAVGSLTESVKSALDTNPGLATHIQSIGGEGALVDSFLSAMIAIVGVVAAIYVLQTLLVARAEESTGRLEAILSTATSRSRWLGSHVLCAGFGSVVVLASGGVFTGITAAIVTGDADYVATALSASLAHVPAVLLVGAVVLVVLAAAPRTAIGIASGFVVFVVVAGQFGELLGLPQAVRDLSPFTHVPLMPAAAFDATPELILAALAGALAAASFAAMRRRDLVG